MTGENGQAAGVGAQVISSLVDQLAEIGAEVAEHDAALMDIIRRGARDGALPALDPDSTEISSQLELVDRAGAVYERLSPGERRQLDAVLKSSLERRRHLARLLTMPDAERTAIAFVLSLDEHQRGVLAEHADKAPARAQEDDDDTSD